MSDGDTPAAVIPRRGGRRLSLCASILGQVFALARNVVLARLLGPEEFGIAAVIILTINFLDTFSNAGPQNLLVQAKDENPRPLLSAAHSVTIGRGVLTAVLLLALGPSLSELFGLRASWMAVVGLSLASLAGGLLHRGVRMVQRDGDFRPEAINLILADAASLVAAVAVALVTKSHLAVVAGLLARSVVLAGASHLLTREPYRFNWERTHLRRFWSFGWPLLINGPLLFMAAQADRLFISREIGPVALGIYSAILVLIASPSGAILKWLGTIYIPPLANFYHQHGDLRAKGVVYEFTAASLILGLLMTIGFALFGPLAVSLLYGEKYQTTAQLVGLIGFLQVLRFLRAWPSTISLSLGASGGILASTIVRLLTLPIGYAGLVLIGGLRGLVIGFVVGEAVTLLISLAIVNRNASRRTSSGMLPVLILCGLAALAIWAGSAGGGLMLRVAHFALLSAVGATVMAYWTSPAETLRCLKALWERLRLALATNR